MTVYRGATAGTLPGYTLAQVFRLLRHALDDTLREVNLTTPQWGALGCMAKQEGISGAEVARMHHLTPQTMHSILQTLEEHGLIRREPHPTQRTVLRIFLTELGRERFTEATRRVEAVHERVFGALGPDERDMLVDMLERCMVRLEVDGLARADVPCVD